jgi:N-acetylglucosaminyl-diphospho-decaprenol L-rhamnosyltransferase
MSLAVAIINYRTPDYTADCLASLEPEIAAWPGAGVWLLDNASGDDSLPRLRALIRDRGWSGWVRLFESPRNLGFAGGNNHLLRLARAAPEPAGWFLLLNSDTLVHPGCLARARAFMAAHPRAGLMSCMLRNRDGSVQNVCRRFPRPDRETARALGLPYAFPRAFGWADLEDRGWNRESETRTVDWVGGAFMLMRAAALDQAGLMDESFFFYGEDIEFCHRFRRRGWEVWFDPAGSITHFGGGSSDPTRLPDRRRDVLFWYARFQVQRRCYGPAAAAWLRGVCIASFALRLAGHTLLGRRGRPAGLGLANGLRTLTGPLRPEAL